MAELQNANPTILSTAQLPSRSQRREATVHRGPEFKFDDVLAPKQWQQRLPHQASPVSPPSPLSSLSSDGGDDGYDGYDGDDADHDDDDGEGSFTEEPIDEQEIYDLISTISDPEHPHTLGQLSVVNLPDIHITPSPSSAASTAASANPNALVRVLVLVTPTINHCSLVTVIGLAIRVRLEQTLPPNYRVDIQVKEGSHAQDDQVTKQLSDKERVAAALENDTLHGVLDKMLETCR